MKASSHRGRGRRPAAVGVAVYGGQYPTAQVYGPTICRERGAGKRIALTYDDGPEPRAHPGAARAARALRREGDLLPRSASGPSASRSLLRETVAAGHAIGNHTYTHPTMPAHGAARIREELAPVARRSRRRARRFSTVDGAMLMRPPYGRRRPGTLRTMRAEGYVPVTWSITGYDWRAHTTGEAITRRATKAKEGDIILLHDGSNTEPAADRRKSVETTEDTSSTRPQGYEFVTVPELVAAGR